MAREKQDEDNVRFMDLREQASREETQQAKDQIRALEAKKVALEAEVVRFNRMERTDIEFWEEGDAEFFFELEGILSFRLLFGLRP